MAIRITSKQAGRRRAGIAHPKEPLYHAGDRFTAAELRELKADPLLDVKEMADKDIPADAHVAEPSSTPKALAERQAELDRQEEALRKREADLATRADGLKEAEKGLAKRSEALDERKGGKK